MDEILDSLGNLISLVGDFFNTIIGFFHLDTFLSLLVNLIIDLFSEIFESLFDFFYDFLFINLSSTVETTGYNLLNHFTEIFSGVPSLNFLAYFLGFIFILFVFKRVFGLFKR